MSKRAWKPGDVVRYDHQWWGYYLDAEVVQGQTVLVVGRVYRRGGKLRARIERVNIMRLDEGQVPDE